MEADEIAVANYGLDEVYKRVRLLGPIVVHGWWTLSITPYSGKNPGEGLRMALYGPSASCQFPCPYTPSKPHTVWPLDRIHR